MSWESHKNSPSKPPLQPLIRLAWGKKKTTHVTLFPPPAHGHLVCSPWTRANGSTYQLPSQQGHVLNDCQPHSPLGILCQLHNGWQQRLGKLPDANHFVHAVQVGDDVQPDLRALWTRAMVERMRLQSQAETLKTTSSCGDGILELSDPPYLLPAPCSPLKLGLEGRWLLESIWWSHVRAGQQQPHSEQA